MKTYGIEQHEEVRECYREEMVFIVEYDRRNGANVDDKSVCEL